MAKSLQSAISSFFSFFSLPDSEKIRGCPSQRLLFETSLRLAPTQSHLVAVPLTSYSPFQFRWLFIDVIFLYKLEYILRFNSNPSDVVLTSVLDSPVPVRKESDLSLIDLSKQIPCHPSLLLLSRFPTAYSNRSSTSSGGGNYSPHLPRSLRFEGNPQQRTQVKKIE